VKKLIQGIIEFKQKKHPSYKDTFAKLALGQRPDVLFIACSDSRVAVNVFASTDPGDLFVVRNVGNMVPPSGLLGVSISDESELAALEFAILNLKVKDIIICGHSECGAMHAVCAGREKLEPPHLRSWLAHAEPALHTLNQSDRFSEIGLERHNRLSKINVLQQVGNLKTYPMVAERVANGTLQIHGWWFDIAQAEVFFYDSNDDQFLPFDENTLKKLKI